MAGREDRILYESYRGNRALEPLPEPLTPDTLYDVASLTKPLITALLALCFVQADEIRITDPVRRFLPDFPNHEITILQLATHTSGLPDWHPLYLESRPYYEELKTLAAGVKTGRGVNYSCPGYILLHFILERVAGEPFNQAVQRSIIAPLKLNDVFLRVPDHLRNRCAPTEKGNQWEKRLAATHKDKKVIDAFPWREDVIRGHTHDGNSHYLGGCAGNAGLFATARSVFQLSAEFLPQSARLLRAETLDLVRRNLTPGSLSQRSFGFKLNATPLTSAGRTLSAAAFGHNGFTGTSLWIDPTDAMRYILLSNRVHPRVNKINFNRVRRRLHRALVRRLRKTE
ncbi:MAG: serine hydrolase domain-containing protein [Acidobacteriota bacterium]|nr:serine hydrolase domain-containing protein [Acidobacteriota bacterium]